MTLESGRRLGPYQVLSALGAGGMGEVYRARDTRLGRDVAVKVLPPEVAGDPARRSRFEREARAVAAFNHPGILGIHDVGEDSGLAFIVTELLEGETLRKRLRRGPVPAERVAEWGAAAAEALAVAHARGIVHRDLKPENLFLTRDGRLKILDFGLAKELLVAAGGEEDPTLSSPTRAGIVLGTLGYLSPEQARGETVDGRSDIFSLGCVLYEALCGKRAFGGQTAQDLIAAVLRDEPADAASLRPDAPAALARVLGRCLAKEREARFQSASDLAFALRSLAQGSGAQLAAAGRAPVRLRLGWPLLALLVGVAGLAAGYWLRPAGEVAEPMVLALTPGTSREASPAISPDGKFVAYLASEQGRTDVWVKFVGGGPAVNLTAGSGLEFQGHAMIGGLEISPDGSVIAVQAGAPGSSGIDRGVWLIPAPLGGPPRKLVERAAGLRWSADGSRVAFMRPDPVGGDSILVARSDGSDERVVVPPAAGLHAHEPAWSHDDAWIYFDRGPMAGNEAPTEIWRAPSRGGAAEQVVGTPGVARSPMPAPDGRGLIYVSEQSGGAPNVWWRPLGGGRERRLTRGAGDYVSPRVSRDGRRLVCEARTSVGSLRALDLSAAQGLGQWLTRPGGGDVGPSSARSGRIAFASARNGTSDIWISEPDGGSPRPLTSDADVDSDPAISPDGGRVAFVSSRGGRRGLWLVSTEGGAPRPLAAGDVLDRPSWSGDGGRLVYAAAGVDGRAGLWIVSDEGGSPEAIPRVSGRAPAWSPAGDMIAYVTAGAPSAPRTEFTSSRGEPLLTQLELRTIVGALAFSWDGRRLAIGESPGSAQANVSFVDLASGTRREVARLPHFTGVRGIAWSADERRLIYGLVQHESRILLFDGLDRF